MFRGTVIEARDQTVVIQPLSGELRERERVWILLDPPVSAVVLRFRTLADAPGMEGHMELVLNIRVGLEPGTLITSASEEPLPPMRVTVRAPGDEAFWAALTAAQNAGIPIDGAGSSATYTQEFGRGGVTRLTVVVFNVWEAVARFLAPRVGEWIQGVQAPTSIQLAGNEAATRGQTLSFSLANAGPGDARHAIELIPRIAERRSAGSYVWDVEEHRWIREDDGDGGAHDRSPLRPRSPELGEGAEAQPGE